MLDDGVTAPGVDGLAVLLFDDFTTTLIEKSFDFEGLSACFDVLLCFESVLRRLLVLESAGVVVVLFLRKSYKALVLSIRRTPNVKTDHVITVLTLRFFATVYIQNKKLCSSSIFF